MDEVNKKKIEGETWYFGQLTINFMSDVQIKRLSIDQL